MKETVDSKQLLLLKVRGEAVVAKQRDFQTSSVLADQPVSPRTFILQLAE